MKNCLQFARQSAAAALLLAGGISLGYAQNAGKDTPGSAGTQRFVVTASGEKIPLTSGVEKHVGKITYLDGPTIIDNRIDSNAILGLEERPLAPAAPKAVATAPAEAPKAAAEVAQPAKRDLQAELKSANVRYTQAKADLAAAQKSGNQTAMVTARHDIAAAKDEIAELKKEIARQNTK